MSNASEEDNAAALRERLGDLDRQRKGKRGGSAGRGRSVGGALVGVAAIGAVGLLGYYVAGRDGEADAPLGTSEASDFQGEGEGFGDMEFATPAPTPAAPAAAPEVTVTVEAAPAAEPAPAVVTGPSDTELALIQTLAELREEMATMREGDGSAPAAVAGDDGRMDELAAQLASLSAETAELREGAADAQAAAALAAEQAAAEIAGLETQLAIAQEGAPPPEWAPVPTEAVLVTQDDTGARIVEMGDGGTSGESEADAARRAELERRRQEEADFLEARIRSPLVAVGGGGGTSLPGGEAAAATEAVSGAVDFVQGGAAASEVQQAVVIANPDRTVIQGTVIQAAMETAIDSSLPGAIRAVVAEDVHSYDGTRILIPRGSKLIGRYDAELEATQRRLVIAWDRIITPDNQSVTLAAYGADELGRSGTEGVLDRRLGTRFGSAALVSLISALPGAAAGSVGDPALADLAGQLGEDAADAGGSVLDAYLSVAPTIYVDQGARITVIVDRDLEML